MIYDGLEVRYLYRGLSKGLDVLIDWLDENDPATLPLGKTQILGDKVFANVMDAKTRRFEDARFEVHRKYMDVQIDLVGHEDFMTTPGKVIPAGEFDEPADKGYCHEAPENHNLLKGSLEQGRFAIFMIGEPHMPNLVPEGQEVGPIKKICFKVLGDQYWDEV